jgi:hypothetical protein
MSVDVTRSTPYDDLPQWLNVHEVATILGWTPWAVYQNIHRGEIPYRRVGKKAIQVPREFFHPNTATQRVTA